MQRGDGAPSTPSPARAARTVLKSGGEGPNLNEQIQEMRDRKNKGSELDRPAPGHFMIRKANSDESCLFHPQSPVVQHWNVIVALLLAIQAVILPLQLAFVSDEMLEDFTWLVWFTCWGDMVLWLDVLLQCFLQVQSPDRSYWIRDNRAIAWRYCKKELLIDLCGLLPLRYLITTQLALLAPPFPGLRAYLPNIGRNNARCSLQLLGFHKLLRFSRIIRVARSLQAHDITSHMQFSYRHSRLGQSAATVAFTCHVMGCLWSTLAVCGQNEEHGWFHSVKILKGNESNLYGADNFLSMYMCSLYWAVFTLVGVGYGDIVPISAIEYIMASCCMLIAALVWAWVIANIVSVMATMNESANEHLQTLDCINELMSEKGMKVHFGRRLREYFSKIRDVKEHDSVGGIVRGLSPALKSEVVYAIHGVWLEKVWWLNKVPRTSEFIVEMTLHMKACLHAPNELIPNKQELSVILRGLCIHGGCLKSREMIFGEDMLLNNEALRKPFATLAMTFLHLLTLTRPLLNSLVLKFPEAAIPIRRSYVQFAIVRGMLYKAELYRRREQMRTNPAAKRKQIAAYGAAYKPQGDSEDVIGEVQAVGPGRASRYDMGPMDSTNMSLGAGGGPRAPQREAQKGSRQSTAGRLAVAAAGAARLSKGLTTLGSMMPAGDDRSHMPESAADLLVGFGAEEHHIGEQDVQIGGTTANDLSELTQSTKLLTNGLRTRCSTIEAAVQRLLEQARLLEDL